jgi:hypothetical protein
VSYYKQVADLAEEIQSTAREIANLEKSRNDWIRPKATTFWLGQHTYVTREDGTTPKALQGVKREALKAFDDLIFTKKSELEGLRFKLVNLAKQGGAA